MHCIRTLARLNAQQNPPKVTPAQEQEAIRRMVATTQAAWDAYAKSRAAQNTPVNA